MNYCSGEDPAGLMVFIPGESFLAITGPSGSFNLSFLPDNIYEVVVMKDGTILQTIPNVEVTSGMLNDLGLIQVDLVGVDNDGDCHADGADCNDNDPNIYPGAEGICEDGIDNNCNGMDDACVSAACTIEEIEAVYVCTDSCAPGDIFCIQDCLFINPTAYYSPQCAESLSYLFMCAADYGCAGQFYLCLEDSCTVYYNEVMGEPECDSWEIRTCGSNEGICQEGFQSCKRSRWFTCEGEIGPSTEYCDGLDNDCDGQVDEGCP